MNFTSNFLNWQFKQILKIESYQCGNFYFFGTYLIALFMLGLPFNLILLGKYVTTKPLRKPGNLFLIALVSTNLLSIITYLPIEILTNLSCG